MSHSMSKLYKKGKHFWSILYSYKNCNVQLIFFMNVCDLEEMLVLEKGIIVWNTLKGT